MNDQTLDLALRREYALKVQAKPEFLELFQASVEAELSAKNVKVESDAMEAHAVSVSGGITRMVKETEALRLEIVTMPTRFTRMVNENFRTITDAFGRAKARVDGARLLYMNKKRMEYEAAMKLQEKENKEVKAVSPDMPDAVRQMQLPPTPPTSVVETESAKQYVREVPYVEITDKEAVVKAVVSKAKGLEEVTIDIVEIDVKKLEEIVLKKKVKVPGTVIKVKQIMVTQSK